MPGSLGLRAASGSDAMRQITLGEISSTFNAEKVCFIAADRVTGGTKFQAAYEMGKYTSIVEVLSAEDGVTGVDLAQTERPTLIIYDIMMPLYRLFSSNPPGIHMAS